jgi:hypothetical protein
VVFFSRKEILKMSIITEILAEEGGVRLLSADDVRSCGFEAWLDVKDDKVLLIDQNGMLMAAMAVQPATPTEQAAELAKIVFDTFARGVRAGVSAAKFGQMVEAERAAIAGN